MGSADTPSPPAHEPQRADAQRDEAQRLAALRRTGVLDTAPEENFDRLTRLAQRLLRAPVALVSLVDAERQFFKSAVGLPEPWHTARETPLSHSFCKHVAASGNPLVVEDARVHHLVKDNGAVADLGVVAYAGMPLLGAGGACLGSFCAIDNRPRRWTDDELETLRTLAASAATELELRAVAEERRVQRDLAEREHSLSMALLESSRDGIYGLDRVGRCTFVNHAAARMLGYEPSELVGRDLRALVGPAPAGEGQDDAPADGADFVCGEADLRCRNGSALPVTYSSSPLVREGAVAGTVVTFSDASERRRADQALRHTNAILSAVVDGTSDAVFVKDARGRYVMINAAGCAIVGRTSDEMLGRDDTHVFDADTARRVMAIDREVMETGLRKTVEHTYAVAGGGPELTLMTFKGPYRDESGKVVGVIGIARDITRRVRAEQELKKAKEQAEAASRAKDRFLAVLSHELRTPLTPALALVSAWENNPTVPPELADDLAMIRRNIDLEVRLIDDLLDLTRVTRGKLRLALRAVDLHGVLRDAMANCCAADELRRARVALEADFEATDAWVRADPARLQQVFLNLLTNALKFTPPGGSITVRTRDEPGGPDAAAGGRICVEVIDTGIGIEPHVLPRLFDAFEQGQDGVTRRFGGLGLGLAICKALVAAHRGEITASSEGAGQGATFAVVLARCEAPQEEEPRRPAAGAAGVAAPRNLRILLVEDHVDTSRAMSRLLSRIGHEVRTAGTVRAAVEAAQAAPVDLVISDVGLPDGSGHDLMRTLRGLGPVRGIALSGYGTDEDVRRSRDAGFDTHLTKPTDFDRLVATIEKLAE